MKKFLFIIGLLACTFASNSELKAQNINININIGRQPAWGPVGYDYVGFYYFPDINCYYDVNVGVFYYPNAGRWVSARNLPRRFRNYDLYRIHKVVINQPTPWRFNQIHCRDYRQYVGHYSKQVIIRDSRDQRYIDQRNSYRNQQAYSGNVRKKTTYEVTKTVKYTRDANGSRNSREQQSYRSYENTNNERRPTRH